MNRHAVATVHIAAHGATKAKQVTARAGLLCKQCAPQLPTLTCNAVQEAKKIGDEYLSLEKYVNLNYLVSMLHPCVGRMVLAPSCTF